MSVKSKSRELLIVGGGLAGGLLAYRLSQLKPELPLQLLEQGPTLGGNHTWSFHHGDLSPSQLEWVRPLLSASWAGYDVKFPHLERTLPTRYYSITSEQFHARVLAQLTSARVRLNQPAPRELFAGKDEVIDARGPGPASQWPSGSCGFQKFVGLELELEEPHGLELPLLMDVRVPQKEGFRFFYLLPWSPTRILIEDTRYSMTAEIDTAAFEFEIQSYVTQRGWRVLREVRREQAALPIPLRSGAQASGNSLGYRGGFFHPTTGYSLAEAVRVADAIASLPQVDGPSIRLALERERQRVGTQSSFFYLLNRMLFRAHEDTRYRILERFYGLSARRIERFYSGALRASDKFRILAGRPPLPIHQALGALLDVSPTLPRGAP